MALNTNYTNVELWNLIRSQFPQFAQHTAEATAEMFTDRGFEQLQASQYPDVLNDFWQLSMRVYFQLINRSDVRDDLSDNGFGEYFTNPNGGYIQRMAMYNSKPVSPAYKNLTNGSSPDPFVVRKAKVEERLFRQNFDYQSLITIPDEYQFKQIFISEYGMAEFMAGLMESLNNGYTIQLTTNKLEAINAGINSTTYPLKDTQKVGVALSANPTESELKNFVQTVKDVVSAMTLGPQSSAFNAMSFPNVQDKSRLKILVRPNLENAISVNVLASAFNPDELGLGIDIVTVPHFGGLKPYEDAEFTTPLYPVYDSLGSQIGWNTQANQSNVTVEDADVFWQDPNENVIALIADKGYVFYSEQNPYRVEPIRNPRGLYTNYWASSPNNTVAVDHLYNIVAILNTNIQEA